LKALTDGLKPHLEALRQRPYYAEPRFHFSIAWALLESAPSELGVPENPAQDNIAESQQPRAFPVISGLPDNFEGRLERVFGAEIRSSGNFEVETVDVKIGKQISSLNLMG